MQHPLPCSPAVLRWPPARPRHSALSPPAHHRSATSGRKTASKSQARPLQPTPHRPQRTQTTARFLRSRSAIPWVTSRVTPPLSPFSRTSELGINRLRPPHRRGGRRWPHRKRRRSFAVWPAGWGAHSEAIGRALPAVGENRNRNPSILGSTSCQGTDQVPVKGPQGGIIL